MYGPDIWGALDPKPGSIAGPFSRSRTVGAISRQKRQAAAPVFSLSRWDSISSKPFTYSRGRTLGYHFGMDCRITDDLIAMAEHDRKVSDELAASGALYEGYDPRMAAVHEKNAQRLRAIMAQIGWPTERLVGKRAADAAWLIAQHAIAHPEFQRSCLKLLAAAAHEHLVPAWQPAMLEDRIRVFEGRPQLYGTQLEPDAHGNMRPHTIEDPGGVDERRRAVSLEPLAEILTRAKRQPLPADRERFEHDYQEWLIAVGWRTRPQSSSKGPA